MPKKRYLNHRTDLSTYYGSGTGRAGFHVARQVDDGEDMRRVRNDLGIARRAGDYWRQAERLAAGLAALFLAFGFAWPLGATEANVSSGTATALPTITTAKAAHGLSGAEARRGYPIHLRGVVTYFDKDTGTGWSALYVHDATGNIFIKFHAGAFESVPIGSVLDVRGVSNLGGFAPIVDHPEAKVVGAGRLPAVAPMVSRTELAQKQFEGQWVGIEGIVHSVRKKGHTVILEVAVADGILYCVSVYQEGVSYQSLVDARVRVLGNEAPLYNGNGQLAGGRVMFPDISAVKVLEPGPADVYQMPVVSIDELFRWDQIAAASHRVHLRGKVTIQWPGLTLCIRDATQGLCAQSAEDTRVALGDEVEVAGFAGTENSTTVLTDAVFRATGHGEPVAAELVTAEQVLQGGHNSELIQMEGLLIGRDLSSADTTLILSAGKFLFNAVLPQSLAAPGGDGWENGSRLRVSGICSMQFDAQESALKDGMAVPRSFRVILRSPADVVVVQKPSWWTLSHALVLLAIALAAALAVLGWVIVLRRRVEQQAELIRQSEEIFRHMALHDELTGLATRRLLNDRLGSAVDVARRRKSGLALLMLDLDSFKEINDSYGHSAGDEVLRVTASRILAGVRKTDTVARLGGDEFVVVLPDSGDGMPAILIAEKLGRALAVPVLYEGRSIPVTVSIGVQVCVTCDLDGEELMRHADVALYEAKERGRNRVEVYSPKMEKG